MAENQEEEHETFEAVGAGASLTYPMQVAPSDTSAPHCEREGMSASKAVPARS
jgi:hypothetical protein